MLKIPAVLRNVGYGIPALAHKFPEGCRIGYPAGETAADADDGYGFAMNRIFYIIFHVQGLDILVNLGYTIMIQTMQLRLM